MTEVGEVGERERKPNRARRWIDTIDRQYHDQAQFVRDFCQFMGMTPSHYAALPKPLLGAIMRERARLAGSAAQALDSPHGPSLLG